MNASLRGVSASSDKTIGGCRWRVDEAGLCWKYGFDSLHTANLGPLRAE